MCSWGGRGRAGTVGATLLAHLYGLSADEALERVQRAFDTRKDGEGMPGGCTWARPGVCACPAREGMPRREIQMGGQIPRQPPRPPALHLAPAGGRRSPETDEQHAFVREFIAQAANHS